MIHRQHTGRKLKLNHSNALPRYIIAYDAETLPVANAGSARRFSHRFRLGVAIVARIVDNKPVGIKIYRITHPAHFWLLVEQTTGPRHTTWVVCHNAIFDMIVTLMPQQFESGKLTIEWPRSKRQKEDNDDANVHASTLCIIESPPTIIAAKCSATMGRLVIVDTLNWFPVALAELGKACGKEKLPMPAFKADNEKWFEYCERDTQIVFDTFVSLLKWVRDNDMGMFRYTGPSQAMGAYRHRFSKTDIYFHDNGEVKSLERSGYFGGRSEVFKMGEITETVYQYDINSLFPFIMSAGLFPSMLDRYEIREEHLELLPDIDWAASVAEVELHTWEPIFPRRTERGVTYPIGTFCTTLCGQELELAHKRQYIRKVGSWAEYKLADLFGQWVSELWAMRQKYKRNRDPLYDRFTKTLLNGLYGKFAQMTAPWQNVNGILSNLPWSNWVQLDLATGTRTQYRSFGWQVQRKMEREEMPKTLVAISAFVTSAARAYMNKIRDVVGSRHCYYQGVDGIVVTVDGKRRLEVAGLIKPDTLGYLRHELTTNTGIISGVSDYRLGEKVAIAGRARLQTVTELRQQMQRRFHSVSHLFDGVSLDHVTEEQSEWHKQTAYWKGIVTNDGWVKPLEIGAGHVGT